MRILFIAIAFLLSFSTFAQKNSYDLVINNIKFIDVNTGKLFPPSNVYIKNGVVEITNKMMKIAAPKEQIDGTGKYFMPALYDMHVHFPEQNAERFFQLQTAAGITNCRIMKSTKETVAFSRTAKNIPAMKISYNFFGNETYKTDSIATVINSLKAKGYHFIKVLGVKNEEYFDAIMAVAKANDIMVCGHALGKINAKKVLASGYKSIEHVGYFDRAKSPEALDSLIDLAVKNNVFICPTLDWSMMVYHSVPEDSLQYRAGYTIGKKLYNIEWDTAYAATNKQLAGKEKQSADFMRNGVANKIAILAKMRAKGVKIIAGSDAEEPYQTPGFSLLDELKLIQKAGFTNAELLQMVTINAKNFFSNNLANPKMRTLEKTNGYILLSKNPLEDINNLGTVEYVIKGSEVIDTKKLLESIK
jgi:imidazolonepropionase-like amidohydrolase